jgi:indolepyruvate ferredoxin oxidoreductase alpha subunit
MKEYGKGHVFSDIGCYTLGFMPPYNSINSCVDMGASITMAKGAVMQALPSVARLLFHFAHSGSPASGCIFDKSNELILILDTHDRYDRRTRQRSRKN